MTTYEDIAEGDSLLIRYSLVDTALAVKDISAATVTAKATNKRNTIVTADTITITDGPNGEVSVLYAAGSLTKGVWELQTRVTIGTEVQTYFEIIPVRETVL